MCDAPLLPFHHPLEEELFIAFACMKFPLRLGLALELLDPLTCRPCSPRDKLVSTRGLKPFCWKPGHPQKGMLPVLAPEGDRCPIYLLVWGHRARNQCVSVAVTRWLGYWLSCFGTHHYSSCRIRAARRDGGVVGGARLRGTALLGPRKRCIFISGYMGISGVF